MTERQSSDVIEMLRARLGMRYDAGMNDGRREIIRVLSDELHLDHNGAEAMLDRLIDAGMIRYVTGDEQDPVTNDEGRVDAQDTSARSVGRDPVTRGDPLLGAAVGQGGPSAAASGQLGGPVLPPGANLGSGGPVAASGAGAPIAAGGGAGAPGTLAASAIGADGRNANDGYWDFRGDKAGVVPSTTRKGQVEPKGT